MSYVWVYCRCCYSAETLEELSGPELDVYSLIYKPQGLKIDDSRLIACLRCREFLKEVHNFIIERHTAEKHEVGLINSINQNSSPILIKTEIKDELRQNNIQIKDVEVEYDPQNSRDDQLTENLECDDCTFTLDESDATPHASNSSDDKPFSCNQCGHCFKRKDNLSIHLRSHLNDSEKPYKCNECSYTTTTKKNLNDHIACKHSDEKPFSCDQCDYRSKLKAKLVAHKKMHLKDCEKPYQCRECSYATITFGNLKDHIACKHSDEKPFSCDQCNYCSKLKAKLVAHKKIHLKDCDKPYKCSECSYTTTTLGNLRDHAACKHSDEKPFSCNRCDYRTKRKKQLAVHMRSHLTDLDKPYKCSTCSYTSATKADLQRHVAYKHSNEKPFSCDQCHYRAKIKRDLTIHQRRHKNLL